MTRLIGLLLALASMGTCAFAGERKDAKTEPPAPSMRFEWRVEPGTAGCGKECRRWLYAAGPITPQTPDDFTSFAAPHDLTGATLVLDSEGGSVSGAMELGRKVRALGMRTTVGRLAARTGSDAVPVAPAPDAACSSMCGFVLLAGVQRHVPREASVNVHQIWLAKKRNKILTSSYTAAEVSLVQRDVARLARYTVEMAGDLELFEIALQVPSWGPMHRLSADELVRAKLITPASPSAATPVAAGPSPPASGGTIGRP
jgi:hypothetical protein